MNMIHRPYPKQRGFSLVELMVGLVIGLFVTGVMITVFVQSKRNFTQDEQVSNMQENGRYALQLLSREIAHAGFLGGMSAIDSVSPDASVTFVNDCADWFNPLAKPIEVNTAAAANGKDCFDGETVKAGTEVMVIKRTAGKQTATADIAANKLYFTTPGQGGTLFKSVSDTLPSAYASGQQQWEYYVEIYYIKDDNRTGDTVPGLFRKRLVVSGGSIAVTDDGLLVSGIRTFGLLYGIDSATSDDGIADQYTVATSYSGDMNRVVSARITVLAMSTDEDHSNTNSKSYSMYPSAAAAASVAGLTNTKYYGRTFSTTTQVRNNAYRIQIYNLSK